MTSHTHTSSRRNPDGVLMPGQAKHVVDLDLTVARTGPDNRGAGRPFRRTVGRRAPPPKKSRYKIIHVPSRCVKTLERAEKTRRLRIFVDADVEVSRERVRRCASV